MTLDVDVCSPKGTYVIVEEVHPMTGAPTKPSGLGPNLIQVVRHVYQACEFQDQYFFDGRPVETGRPSAWQYILHLLSRKGRITTAGSGKEGWLHAFSGFKSVVSALPKIRNALPSSLTKEHEFQTSRSPFVFGVDPIPHVELHRRHDIGFSSVGGVAAPRAIAIYHGETGTLDGINDPITRDRILAEFVRRRQTSHR